jgi:hypothetical protein
VRGVYHEAAEPMGSGRQDRDGLSKTWLTSTITTFSAERASFRWPPTQGDIIYLRELGRMYRITDIKFEMRTRTVLVLESLQGVPAA